MEEFLRVLRGIPGGTAAGTSKIIFGRTPMRTPGISRITFSKIPGGYCRNIAGATSSEIPDGIQEMDSSRNS